MSTKNVVLCYPVGEADLVKLGGVFRDYRIIEASQQSIAQDLFQADIFCGHAKNPVDWDAVVSQGRLRWIQSSAAGLDHCLVPSVVAADIVVSGCSGLFANQVAEQTMALLYGMIRRIPTFLDQQKSREFCRQPTDTLHSKSVAIIGYGGNGRRIAELLNGIAGKILVTDTFPDYQIPDWVQSFPANQLDDVIPQADVIIVTLPLTDETHHAIAAKQFSLMRPGTYFINVARGAIVDQEALITAIKHGPIAFAGLDVVDPEPLPVENELWQLGNVMITPHVGAQSENRVRLTTELFCRNLPRFENRRALINQVDKVLQCPRPKHRLTIDAAANFILPPEMR